jgi:MFS family permease
VLALGTAQILAWGSSYYLPAVLAAPMARELGLAPSAVFGAFSAALVLAAIVGPWAGHAIDRWGGRPVLAASNLVFAAGLATLALARDAVGLGAGWLLLGVAMGAGLYEGAFAAVVRMLGAEARGAVTGITLLGGFASTIGWPLTAWLDAHDGWRFACLAWAALHLAVGLPLHAFLPGGAVRAATHDGAPGKPPSPALAAPRVGPAPQDDVGEGSQAAPDAVDAAAVASRRALATLAFVFAAGWFIGTAMSAHLPRVLEASHVPLREAVLVGALIGPAQVGARLLEFGLLRRLHPLVPARIAALLHPLGALAFLAFGAPAAAVFGVLHGAGNGILTIAKGTLPLALFGAAGYGRRQGLLTIPARIAQAAAPFLFGLCLERWGVGALWLTTAVGLLALGALLGLPRQLR